MKQGRLEEAAAGFQEAVHLKPDHADAYNYLGHVCRDLARLDAALAAFRMAMQLRPGAHHFHSNLLMALNLHPGLRRSGDPRRMPALEPAIAEPLEKFILPHANLADPARRLRIGYVSPDFRDHADAFFMVPLLSNHDHRQFEIFCYADVTAPDALTERLRGYADVWRDTVGLSDEQVADMVRGRPDRHPGRSGAAHGRTTGCWCSPASRRRCRSPGWGIPARRGCRPSTTA